MSESYLVENCLENWLASRRRRRFNTPAKKGQTFRRFMARLRVKLA